MCGDGRLSDGRLVGLLLVGRLSGLLLVGRLSGSGLSGVAGGGRCWRSGCRPKLVRSHVGFAQSLDGIQSFRGLANQADNDQTDHTGNDQGDADVENQITGFTVGSARCAGTAVGLFGRGCQHRIDDVDHSVGGLNVHQRDVGRLDHAERERGIVAVDHAEFLAFRDIA